MVFWCIVDCFDDIDDCVYVFNILFSEVFDKYVLIKKVKIWGRFSFYIIDEIREFMKFRDWWRKIVRRIGKFDVWIIYKNFRNDVKRKIRLVECVFVVD